MLLHRSCLLLIPVLRLRRTPAATAAGMAACMATALAAALATLAPSEVSLPSDRPDPETPANDGAAARAGPLLLGMHPSLALQGTHRGRPPVHRGRLPVPPWNPPWLPCQGTVASFCQGTHRGRLPVMKYSCVSHVSLYSGVCPVCFTRNRWGKSIVLPQPQENNMKYSKD